MQKNGDFPSQGFQDTPPPPLQTPTKLFYCKAPFKIRQNYFIASTYVIQHACKLYNSARIVQLRTRPSQKIFHWKFKMLSIFSCSNGPQKHTGIKKISDKCTLPLDLDPPFFAAIAALYVAMSVGRSVGLSATIEFQKHIACTVKSIQQSSQFQQQQ